jgi:hypothetical protein
VEKEILIKNSMVTTIIMNGNNQTCLSHNTPAINLSVKERKRILEDPNLTAFRRKLLYSSIMRYQFRRRISVPFPLAI